MRIYPIRYRGAFLFGGELLSQCRANTWARLNFGLRARVVLVDQAWELVVAAQP